MGDAYLGIERRLRFAVGHELEARVLSDDGEGFRHQVQVFVDGRKLGTLDGLETALSGDETVR